MKDRVILTIKALAIIGVVFHHSANRRFEPHTREYLAWVPWVFTWAVLAFMAVSGWLHALSQEKKQKPFLGFTLNRARRLLLPFVLLIIVYAAMWQLAGKFTHVALSGSMPDGFFAKITTSLWPTGGNNVAEQLYFLPLLFGVAIVVHSASAWHDRSTALVTAVAATAFAFALWQYPLSLNVGFSFGVFLWSIFSYAGGFLLFRFRGHTFRFVPLLACSLLIFFISEPYGVMKMVPLWLLAYGPNLGLDRLSWLHPIGDASGTIYAYHTPFILQPMLIAASSLVGWRLQLGAAIVAVTAAIAICTVGYHLAKKTPLKALLM